MKNSKTSSFIGLLLIIIGYTACNAGVTYNFVSDSVTAPGLSVNETAQDQLFLDVSAYGDSQALFTFRNIGPDTGVITDVFFKENALPGVIGTTLSNVKTASTPGMNIKSQSDSGDGSLKNEPVALGGVNPGQSMTITYGLRAGKTFDDLLADISSRKFQVRIKVQDFDDGIVYSFTNTPYATIPLPGAILLSGIGIISIGWIRKKKMM